MTVLGRLKPRRALVITHRNADVDGISSALAIKRLLLRLNRKARVDLVAPQGVSSQSKKVLEILGETFFESIPPSSHDVVFITDTGHSNLLDEELASVKRKKGKKFLVDHHPLDRSMKKIVDKAIVDESASSASEMAYRLFLDSKLKIDRDTAFILALGIMADSQFLSIARSQTLLCMADLIEKGVDVEEVRAILRTRREPSEQIARIKGARRASFFRCDQWVVGITNVGSYHASVARGLIDLGCDLATAVGVVEGETRGSVRETQSFYSATKVHVGNDICRKIADELGGSGGGHPTAGSFNTKTTVDEVIKKFSELVEDLLRSQMKILILPATEKVEQPLVTAEHP
jgi:nanoRNase/pAp phosphatase (c-di-AMP/oligoRNAs hydrolase)